MSRTSKALTRLGIAGVAAATMGAGLPVLLATSASAAPAAQLTLNPNPARAAAGTCQVFTVDATDSTGAPATYDSATPSVTVQVSESPDAVNQVVTFCNPSTPFANLTGADDDTEQDTDTTAETAVESFGLARTPATGSSAVTATTPTRATFGIRSNAPGGATLRAFIDADSDGTFDAGELQVLGTASFTAGGNNTAENAPGGNAAQDAAATLTTGATNSPVVAGNAATATVNVKNAAGDNVSGVIVNFRVTAGPNGPQTSGTTTTPGLTGQATTNNAGNATIQYTTNGTRTGSDTVQFFVNQTSGTTSGPDANEPTAQNTIVVNPAPSTNVAEARNVDLTPESVTTVAGNSSAFVAKVITGSGAPVQGVPVTFREEGPGRFANGASEITVNTNSSGEATATTTSVAGESGSQIIVASIASTGNQTGQAAGTPTGNTRAGNSSDTSTQTFVATSPSASPSSPAPSGSPATGTVRLGIDVAEDTIVPTEQGGITVTGTPNATIELLAYSRPSTTYRVVRTGSLGTDGTIRFNILPGTNTRLFAQYTGATSDALDSPSVVQNVATALSLTVIRNGSLNYTFQGRILPRRSGQLITLYRVDDQRGEVITSQVQTDSTGTWRINRRFVGQGIFPFVARTGQNLTNVSGDSNVRPTAIYAGPQR